MLGTSRHAVVSIHTKGAYAINYNRTIPHFKKDALDSV